LVALYSETQSYKHGSSKGYMQDLKMKDNPAHSDKERGRLTGEDREGELLFH
jgi:hypothetical protein